MDTIRCPLYTLSDGLGLPVFLQHQYIGTSRAQLVQTIGRRGLLTAQEIQSTLEVRILYTLCYIMYIYCSFLHTNV